MTLFSRTFAGIALGASLFGSFAQAASVGGFTSFWALGDSLTDDGNLYAATGGKDPLSPPYYQGRFSNGPVWADHVAAKFTAKRLANDNFAYGGARAITNTEDPIPDLATQLGLFAANSAGRLGARPVVSMWIGANDLLFNGIPNGTAATVGRQAARAVGGDASLLAGFGVRDVLMFNLPDLGDVPAYALSPDARARAQASRGSAAYNATLDRQIVKLEKSGLNVIKIDMAGLFKALLDDPKAFGVDNATIPCFVPTSGQPPCSADEALRLAFFDPVHPNSVIHGAIADVVLSEIAPSPVPIPAPALLLLAAFGGLGVVRRRTVRAA